MAGLVLGGVFVGLSVASLVTAGYAVAQTATSIVVEGNRRVESDTIRSYFRVGPGERLDAAKVDEGVKALFATGLFRTCARPGRAAASIVTVVENSVISRVRSKATSASRTSSSRRKSSRSRAARCRGRRCRPTCSASSKSTAATAATTCASTPKIIDRPNNRVDLVFEINEGGKTTVKEIDFVGNRAYSTWRLRDVIKTGQSNMLSFLKNNDLYDPDRVEADRELLRRWYLKNGYADVRIVSAVAEFDPARNGFILTFTIEEGERYKFGAIDIQSSVRDVDIGAASSCASLRAAPTTPRWSRNRSRR